MPVNSCRTPGHSGSHAFPLSVVGSQKNFKWVLAEALTKKHLDPGQGEHILYTSSMKDLAVELKRLLNSVAQQ